MKQYKGSVILIDNGNIFCSKPFTTQKEADEILKIELNTQELSHADYKTALETGNYDDYNGFSINVVWFN